MNASFKALLFAAAGAIALASSAAAQDDPADSDAIDGLLGCRSLEDPSERLACFDRETAALAAAVEQEEVTVVETARIRAVQRDTFGISMPSMSGLTGLFSRSGDAPEPVVEALPEGGEAVFQGGDLETVRGAPVDSVEWLRGNKVRVVLENGQVWLQTDDTRVSPIRRSLRDSLTVEIDRGALGSFFMELSHDGRRFRARRLE